MGRISLLGCGAVALFASLCCHATDADQYVSYTGTAVAPNTQQFLYGERHVLKLREGKLAERVVLYTCSNGAPFARKTVSYTDALAPDFLLEDASNGMRQGVRATGNGRAVFYREDRTEPEKTGALPRDSGLVVDSGFDEFVRANWQSLMSGTALTMHFLVPSRLDDMNFRVEHVRSEEAGGGRVEVFRLKLSSIFGWVLPGIDVYYDAKDHLLVRYVGLSDLRNPAHDNYRTEIIFRRGDRHSSGAHEVDDARQARLMPCK
jgi:hypothetical protein